MQRTIYFTGILSTRKYLSVIALIMYLVFYTYMSGFAPLYNPNQAPISGMVTFLSPAHQLVFNTAFLLKFILDTVTAGHVMESFRLKLKSLPILLWSLPITAGGLLAVFPLNTSPMLHNLAAIAMFTIWPVSQFAFAQLTKNGRFILFTILVILFQYLSLILFVTHITAVYEIWYIILALIWLSLFASGYVK